MAFTPYSTPVEPVEWKPPVSEDLLLKGALFTDKNIQDNIQKADDLLLDKLYSIPSLPGEDTKKKQEIIDGVLQQVSKISHNDFRNPSTLNQLKGYISQVTSNPDFMGIAERGTVTEIETKKQADALAKGKTYYSPILNQAEKYINQGLYIRDTKFNGQGFLDPEVAKMTTEALKNVPVEKYVDANGKVSVRPKKDALDFEMNNVYSNPEVQRFLDYQFDEKYLDRDWATEGALQVQEEMNIFSQTRDFYKNALAKNPNNIEFQQGLYNSERLLQSAEAVLKNPGLNGENLKQLQKQIEIQEQMEDAKKVYNYNSFEKWDVNPLVLQAQKHAHQLSETYAQGEKEIRVNKEKLKEESNFINTIKDPLVRDTYKKAQDKGIMIRDVYGNLRDVATIEKELNTAILTDPDTKAKETIYTKEQLAKQILPESLKSTTPSTSSRFKKFIEEKLGEKLKTNFDNEDIENLELVTEGVHKGDYLLIIDNDWGPNKEIYIKPTELDNIMGGQNNIQTEF